MTGSGSVKEQHDESIHDNWHELGFAVRRSVRYHQRRRRFFEACHRLVVVASLFGGSAAFAAIVSGDYQTVGTVAAAMVAGLNSVDLVIGFARKAWEHSDLVRRFVGLEQKMLGMQATERNYKLLYKERLAIESDEPPILRLVDLQSHNELVLAEGYPDSELYELKWYHKVIAPFFNCAVDSIAPKQTVIQQGPIERASQEQRKEGSPSVDV